MTTRKEYYEQLQAYALGCLDKNDFRNLRNYIHSGEEYPWQELGEYQNLSALLPSILKIEMPDPQLKDKVARKLYRIRDEIRAKKTSEFGAARVSTPPLTPEPPQPVYDEPETSMYEDPASYDEPASEENDLQAYDEEITPAENAPADDIYSHMVFEQEPELHELNKESEQEEIQEEEPKQFSDFEIVTPSRKSSDFFRPSQETQIFERERQMRAENQAPLEDENTEPQQEEDDFYKEENQIQHEEEVFPPKKKFSRKRYLDTGEEVSEKKTSFAVIALTILTIIVLAGGIFAYLSISSDVKKYQSEVEKLNAELQGLTEKTDDTKDLQKILAERDTKIINLSSSGNSGYGKLIINLDQSRGYLQLGGMPEPNAGNSYQLWINTGRNNYISLGLFNSSGAVDYYPVDLPEISNPNEIKILLTEEPSPGSEKPGRKVHLTGSL